MTNKPRRYRSYLVRLWGSENDDRPVWHASTEDTLTGERTNFSGLDQLFRFLEQQTREQPICETTTPPAPE
jgi:hypothetical protein